VDSGRLIVGDDSQSRIGRWGLKRQRPMRAMGVVVRDVDPKGLLEVASADDQQPVQALGADGLHPTLGVRVRLGRFHRGHEHLAALRPEHRIEAAAERGVSVAQDEAYLPTSLAKHQQQVAGLLGDPGTVGVGGHPGQVDPAGVEFDEEQHVQPAQPHRIDGEEVTGDDPGGLLAQEHPPRRGRGSRCRVQPGRCSVVRIAVADTRMPRRSSSPWMRW